MQPIADRLSNPFGMNPPCPNPCSDDVPAVFGYGNPDADFHLVGDHPGRHGGRTTGIPFTESASSERLLAVLEEVGLTEITAGQPRGGLLYMSYLHLCCPATGTDPDDGDYDRFEPFFDAELRAVAAHVLLPVGERALHHVIEEFSSIPVSRIDSESAHASDLSGRGFLIIPIRDPADWSGADEAQLRQTLSAVLASDYQQEADLTRFFPTNTQYLVR